MILDYWFIFPLAIFFSTIAMTFGIGGAAMFTPFFYLVMQLPAGAAVGIGLIIELFGFSAGLLGYARKKLINYKIGGRVLLYSVPGVFFGVVLGTLVPDAVIVILLAVLMIVMAVLIVRPEHKILHKNWVVAKEKPSRYKLPGRKNFTRIVGGIGGAFTGMVSVGIGEISDYLFLKKYHMRGAQAAGTSVYVVAGTVLSGSVIHAMKFFSVANVMLPVVLGITLFAVPGVIIGAQIGVQISQQLEDETRKRYIAALFIALAVVMLISV